MSETDNGYVEERWIFLGRFWSPQNGYIYRWLSNGEELAYKKVKGTVIGGHYILNIKRDGDSVRALGEPKFLNETVDDAMRAVYLARYEEANNQKMMIDAEKRFNSTTPLDRAVEPIEEVARNCRTIGELDALIAVTRTRIIKAWKNK